MAPELGDVDDQRVEARVDQAFHLFRIAPGRERGETHEVGHEHGDEAALVGGGDETLSAFRAKACTVGHGRAARRTGHSLTIPAGRVWMAPRFG